MPPFGLKRAKCSSCFRELPQIESYDWDAAWPVGSLFHKHKRFSAQYQCVECSLPYCVLCWARQPCHLTFRQ